MCLIYCIPYSVPCYHNQAPPESIYSASGLSFQASIRSRPTRYKVGIMVRGNLAISCNFPLVFWAVIGCNLLVVFLICIVV